MYRILYTHAIRGNTCKCGFISREWQKPDLPEGGIFAGDDDISHHGHLTTAPQGIPIDRCNDRLAHLSEVLPTLHETPVVCLATYIIIRSGMLQDDCEVNCRNDAGEPRLQAQIHHACFLVEIPVHCNTMHRRHTGIEQQTSLYPWEAISLMSAPATKALLPSPVITIALTASVRSRCWDAWTISCIACMCDT